MKTIYTLQDEINALRVVAGFPVKNFAGTSKMTLQVILNNAKLGKF